MDPNARFRIRVDVEDTEDTNEEGQTFHYNSIETLTEREVKHRHWSVEDSVVHQLTARIMTEIWDRNPDLEGSVEDLIEANRD